MKTHEQLKSKRHSCRCAGRRGNNRALRRVCGGADRTNGGDDGMNDVASVILACASSAVAGGATGALIQSIRDDAAICRRNRIINNLRRKLNERDQNGIPAVMPDENNDWLRETVRFPTAGGDREN